MKNALRQGRALRPLLMTCALLGALCLTSCADTEDDAQNNAADGTISAPDQSSSIEQTFAGEGSDGKTLIALTRNGSYFMIYACDDEQDAWFRLQAFSSPFEATNPEGAKILIAVDEEKVIGSLTYPDKAPILFELTPTDEDVLFRAEDNQGGQGAVGGWIDLKDGRTRGVIRVGTSRTASRITTTDGLRASEITRLEPAPFTPASLRAPTPNRRKRFQIYGLGDSYGAGEAAPERAGDYEDSGDLKSGGDREVWDLSLTSSAEIREARACHRSGSSGVEVAGRLLGRDYATVVDVRVDSLACSGAQTEHLLSCPYRGAIGDHYTSAADFQQPQITRMKQRIVGGLIDAVYMSVGGNNMRFGQLVSACLGGECGPDSEVEDEFFSAVAAVPAQYSLVAQALRTVVAEPGAIYLSQYPNPLVNGQGQPCPEVDLFKFFGVATVGPAQVRWLAQDIVPVLNSTVEAATRAHSWTLVSQHLALFQGHGYCTRDPWFADNPTSLKLQGNWMSTSLNAKDFPRDTCISPAETPDNPGGTSQATVAGGIVHPTKDGYEQAFGPGIAAAMRPRLEDHIRPAAIERGRIIAQTLRGDVSIGWDELASTETEFRLTIAAQGQAARNVIIRSPDQTYYTIDLPEGVASQGTLRVQPCYVGPTGLSVCASGEEIGWSNTPPTSTPQGVKLDTDERAAFACLITEPSCAIAKVNVKWSPVTQPGVTHYDVELTNVDGSTRRLASTTAQLIATAQLKSAKVRACNLLGCGPASASILGPACPLGQQFNTFTKKCFAASPSIEPKDLMCQGITADPGGVCPKL